MNVCPQVRVWVDDRHPMFRRGLAACVAGDGFAVAGESAGLDPAPFPSDVDILVFEGDPVLLPRAVALAAGSSTRLVAVVPPAAEHLVYAAVNAGAAAVLVRSDLDPHTLLAALRVVAAGSTALPSTLVPRMLERAAHHGVAGPRSLNDRELQVLRMLSDGDDTREIGSLLGYSERTVKNIVHDLLVKMNCRNRVHAVALATRHGLI